MASAIAALSQERIYFVSAYYVRNALGNWVFRVSSAASPDRERMGLRRLMSSFDRVCRTTSTLGDTVRGKNLGEHEIAPPARTFWAGTV